MQAIAAPASIDPGVWAAIPEAARSDVLQRCARQLRRGKSPAEALALALSDLGIGPAVGAAAAAGPPEIARRPAGLGRTSPTSRPRTAAVRAASQPVPSDRHPPASTTSAPAAAPAVVSVRRAAGLRPGGRPPSVAPARRETATVIDATAALVAGLVAEGVAEADAGTFADAVKADPVMAASAPLGIHLSQPYLPGDIRRAVADRISDLGFAEYDRIRALRKAGVKVDFIDPDDPATYRDEDPCEAPGSARP